MKKLLAGLAVASVAGAGLVSAAAPASAATAPKQYTRAAVAKHGTSSNCWTIIGKNVYNLTSMIFAHPGGAGEILELCGRNGTEDFNEQHSNYPPAKTWLASLKVGVVKR